MVLEVRKIILSKGELAMALNGYRRIDPGYLPTGKIVGCEVPNEQEVSIDLEMEEAALLLTRVMVARPRLTDPLIQFCIEHRIMLPRRGKKSALLSEGAPSLFVELETFPVLDFES